MRALAFISRGECQDDAEGVFEGMSGGGRRPDRRTRS